MRRESSTHAENGGTGLEHGAGAPTLATKLLVPPAPRHLVVRERLLQALDRGSSDRLLLLCAPAGSGKTVLLTSWLAARRQPGPHCWLSLDRDDDDASRLIADLLSSLNGSGALPADGMLARLQPPRGADTEGLLPLLINGLAELPSPVVMVLDDVHELSSPQASATLDFLVRHAPPQLRLVLATRTDPALPIARLRIADELTELRTAELAFTREETARLCEQLELGLAEADVELLWTRTEGWAAGLRFATFSLREHADPSQFLTDFAGTDRALADYLASEVLASLALDMREFMLRTCLVEQLSAPLADAMTGLEGSGLMLSRLEHTGALLYRIDQEGSWYRYHPLFAELLRARLRFAHAEEVPLLHRRAARWYAAGGRTMEAIRHALAAEDWEHAAEMVAGHWLELFLRGESSATRRLMGRLPTSLVEADPRLAAAFAGSRLEDGEVDVAERFLAVARERRATIPSDAQPRLRTTLAVVQLERARMAGQVQEAERLAGELARPAGRATQTAASAATHPHAPRSMALSALGTTRLWAGQLQPAAEELRQALALATEGRDDRVTLNCLAQLAIVHLLGDELTRAEEYASKALELCERHAWREGPAAACANLAGALVCYQQGELEECRRMLRRAHNTATAGEDDLRHAIGIGRARLDGLEGVKPAREAALELSAITAGMATRTAPAFLAAALADTHARALLAAGEPAAARALLAESAEPDCARLLVTAAAIELHEGAHEQVELALAPLLERDGDSHPGAELAARLEAWLLVALARHACGESSGSATALDRSLSLAELEPYRIAFVRGGPAVQELLEHQARRGTSHPALLESLLQSVERTPSAVVLQEPLTDQEQRILRYLPTMLSNAEIGAEIFVSLNTVKTHLRSIYRKLNASGRADAVERARQLHLLPAGIMRPRVVRRQ